MSKTTATPTNTDTATAPKTRTRRRPPSRNAKPGEATDDASDHVPAADDDEIDYGPAVEAIDDLLGWAFELARKDVAGWREGMRRVRVAHRYISALVRGKRPRVEPHEEVMFTAALLVRVFDADLGLGVDHIAEMLDQLGLPLDHVPAATPAARAATSRGPIAPSVWRHVRAIYNELSPAERERVRHEVDGLTEAERDGWITALLLHTVEQGADYVRAYLRDQVEAPPPAAPLPARPRVIVRAPASIASPAARTAPATCDGCPLSHFRRAA